MSFSLRQFKNFLGVSRVEDSTYGSESSSHCFEYDQDIPLEDHVSAVLKEVKVLIYGYLLRYIMLVFSSFVLYYLFRATVFISDVYYYDSKIEIFLDRILDRIDNKHLKFLSKFSDALFYTYLAILLVKVFVFNPVVFNIQFVLRFLNIYVFTFILRAFSVIFTTIPPSHPHCTPFTMQDTLFKTFLHTMFRSTKEVPCTGLLFSARGQVVFLGLVMSCQNAYFLYKFLMFIFSMVVGISIIATKTHYSIDVMFSLFFAVTFYYVYFTQMDSYGVYFLNKLNGQYSDPKRKMVLTILERSILNRVVASIEQIPNLIVIGLKLKKLDEAVEENGLSDQKLLKRFKTVVCLFGIDKCDDVLKLYRGSNELNYVYWNRMKTKLGLLKEDTKGIKI